MVGRDLSHDTPLEDDCVANVGTIPLHTPELIEVAKSCSHLWLNKFGEVVPDIFDCRSIVAELGLREHAPIGMTAHVKECMQPNIHRHTVK